MKRNIVISVVIALVLITSAIWIYNSDFSIPGVEIVQAGIILALVLFAAYVVFRRATSLKRGEPAEDELSKKVMLKTAALSYYISLYLWVGIIFAADRVKLETEVLLGSGILAMAVVFALSWLYFNFRGVRNE
jgi:peptidoglycan/LPS O-acetylase OafA/YrhL